MVRLGSKVGQFLFSRNLVLAEFKVGWFLVTEFLKNGFRVYVKDGATRKRMLSGRSLGKEQVGA